MRRFALAAALALLGVGSVAGLAGPHTLAQEATPAAPAALEGITYLPSGYIPEVAMPDVVEMEFGRGTLAPGASLSFTTDDPAAGVMILESGEITATVEDAPWTISRGAAITAIITGTPAADGTTAVVDVIEAGEMATFSAGDAAYIPGSVTGELHNSGDEEAVALLITYRPAGS